MDFGIFNLMGYRSRGVATHTLYDGAIAQVKAAEAAGFDIAWFAEHHFSNYCACPSPLMMVARLAGETSRIKLAPGVVVVPLYNPIRLASEIGMVDALTHGRLVLGIGSGYQPYEFERFSEDLAEFGPETRRVRRHSREGLRRRDVQPQGAVLRDPGDAHRPAAGGRPPRHLDRRRQPDAAGPRRAQGLADHADAAARLGRPAQRGEDPHREKSTPSRVSTRAAPPSRRCAMSASPTARPRPPTSSTICATRSASRRACAAARS